MKNKQRTNRDPEKQNKQRKKQVFFVLEEEYPLFLRAK